LGGFVVVVAGVGASVFAGGASSGHLNMQCPDVTKVSAHATAMHHASPTMPSGPSAHVAPSESLSQALVPPPPPPGAPGPPVEPPEQTTPSSSL
jgi:hypothetical protein